MPEQLQPGPGQGALFGEGIPTQAESYAAQVEREAEVHRQIPNIAAAGDRRNKPDTGMSSAQAETSDPATAEMQNHGSEPACPAWADPASPPKPGNFLPGFGPVTETRLREAKNYALAAYDKYLRAMHEWANRARPDEVAYRLKKLDEVRQAIPPAPEDTFVGSEPHVSRGTFDGLRAQIPELPVMDDTVESPFTDQQRQEAKDTLGNQPVPANPDEPTQPWLDENEHARLDSFGDETPVN